MGQVMDVYIPLDTNTMVTCCYGPRSPKLEFSYKERNLIVLKPADVRRQQTQHCKGCTKTVLTNQNVAFQIMTRSKKATVTWKM